MTALINYIICARGTMDVKLPPKQLYVGSNPIERTSGYNSIYCCLTARATASFYGSSSSPQTFCVSFISNRRREQKVLCATALVIQSLLLMQQ